MRRLDPYRTWLLYRGADSLATTRAIRHHREPELEAVVVRPAAS
jgi:hypothetical protein